MNLEIFLIVATSTTIIALVWQLVFHVYPAYKSAKIAESLSVLAECVKTFDQDMLLNARVSNGHYLHDRFYKLIFCILTHKVNLKFSMLNHIKYDENAESERKKFKSEIDSLDEDTKKLVENATFAVAKILILRNPFIFLSVCFKSQREKVNYRNRNTKTILRDKMITSAELITVKASDSDYSFVPC